jgi:hypothetical protein
MEALSTKRTQEPSRKTVYLYPEGLAKLRQLS